MRKSLLLFLLIVFAFSCAPKTVNNSDRDEKKPEVSATEVVNRFLEAIKSQQYEKAYDYIYIVSSDREGYASRLRSISDRAGLNDYRILGTQLFKESAIIVAELEIYNRNPATAETTTRKTRNRYDLNIIEGEWKITKDRCIENCQ